MAYSTSLPNSARSQQGATLIVALVILAVITIMGLASMRSSNQQLLMSASARDRAIAFQRAEEALLIAEQELRGGNAPSIFNYTPGCPEGLCFFGEFDRQTPPDQCRLTGEAVGAPVWTISDNWAAGRVRPALIGDAGEDGDGGLTVPYIVEFMCFVPSGRRATTGGSGGSVQQSEADVPLYRITARATGDSQRATVMLQSVFRAAQ